MLSFFGRNLEYAFARALLIRFMQATECKATIQSIWFVCIALNFR